MKPFRTLRKYSTNAGLVTLSAGFGLLGILSFFERDGSAVNYLPVDRGFSAIVSAVDLLIAITFLFFAMFYWKRTIEVARDKA